MGCLVDWRDLDGGCTRDAAERSAELPDLSSPMPQTLALAASHVQRFFSSCPVLFTTSPFFGAYPGPENSPCTLQNDPIWIR
jgi:hypothetical protein